MILILLSISADGSYEARYEASQLHDALVDLVTLRMRGETVSLWICDGRDPRVLLIPADQVWPWALTVPRPATHTGVRRKA
jgi:hypothetical protein